MERINYAGARGLGNGFPIIDVGEEHWFKTADLSELLKQNKLKTIEESQSICRQRSYWRKSMDWLMHTCTDTSKLKKESCLKITVQYIKKKVHQSFTSKSRYKTFCTTQSLWRLSDHAFCWKIWTKVNFRSRRYS